jgi:hypothetical protein
MHVLSGIRTRDPSVREGEARLILRGHRDRRPYHNLGGVSSAFHRGLRGSSTGYVMWDLWEQNGTRADFLRIRSFPTPILIPSAGPR